MKVPMVFRMLWIVPWLCLPAGLFAGFDISDYVGSGGKPDAAKIAQYQKELKELAEQELAKRPPFDKERAGEAAKDELGLSATPEPAKEDAEIAKIALKTAMEEANKEFPETLRQKLIAEAKLKYQIYKKDEKITVPLRKGRGFDNYSGVYKGWKEGRVVVGDRVVLREDIPEDKIHFFDEKINKALRDDYVLRNFTEPRDDTKKDAQARVVAELNKERETAKKYFNLIEEKEKKYAVEENTAAVARIVETFLSAKSEEFEKEQSIFKKLKSYTMLDACLPDSLVGSGIDLGESKRTAVNAILKASERYSAMQSKTIPELKELRKKKLIKMAAMIGIPVLLLLIIISIGSGRRSKRRD